MGNRSSLGVVLVISGSVCVVMVLAASAFVAYQQMQAQAIAPQAVNIPRITAPDWVAIIMFIGLLCGFVLAVAGLLVGIRATKAP